MDVPIIRIGTRGSDLAMTQTTMVADALKRAVPGLQVELLRVSTQGDKKQGTSMAKLGDKYDWILELERELISANIDFAVHSGKDVPAVVDSETALLPVLPRANPFDVFVGKGGVSTSFADVPIGGMVGTASLRRRAEILRMRPDLVVVEHRGNVPTRLRKLKDSADLSGVVLAGAGVERLGLAGEVSSTFSQNEMLPAVNQGTLVLQYRKNRLELRSTLSRIVDVDTEVAWRAERGCVSVLDADCNSAVGIFAEVDDDQVHVSCRILSHDGQRVVEESRSGPRDSAEELGRELGDCVLGLGGRELL